MALGAGHGDVDKRQIELVGMFGDRAFELPDVHRNHRLDGRIKFSELDLDPFDDQTMIVCDQHLHSRIPRRAVLRTQLRFIKETIFPNPCGQQWPAAVPKA
jgi:hypothetical protein